MTEESVATVQHARRASPRRWLGWIAMAAAAAAGFSLVYANTVVTQLDSAYHTADVEHLLGERPAPVQPSTTQGDPLTILLMGSDARTGANQSVGGGDVQGMRNDTTIVMHIAGDRSRVDLVSIPRDSQVTIPDCTLSDGTVVPGVDVADFNVAFAHGGSHGDTASAAACVIKTVEAMTGVYIDHYAVVDFTGFIRMIDALGGVPMCIPERIKSSKAHLDLQAGPQILDGTQALAFARLRTAETGAVSGSDLQRINRQHELLRQVARTAMSKNLLTDAGELTQFIRAAAESLTMDPELGDTAYLLGLAYSLKGVGTSGLNFTTVPWKLTDDFLNVTILPEADKMWEDIRNDRPLSVVAADNAGSAWDSGRKEPDTASPTPDSTSTGTSAEDLLTECR